MNEYVSLEERTSQIVDEAPEFTEEGLRKLSILLTPPEPRPDPHAYHREYVGADGACYVCAIVEAAPPLSAEVLVRLAALLPPVPRDPAPANAAVNDPVALAKAAKTFRAALSRNRTVKGPSDE